VAHILVIAYCTFGDNRIKRHVNALAERGDYVDVICLAGDRVDSAANFRVIEVHGARKYRGNKLLRYTASFLNFFFRATAIASIESVRKRYQYVIVRSLPDVTVLSATVAKLRGTKVVLDMIDTMPELFRDRFGLRWHDAGARLLMMQERLSIAMADRVIAMNDLQRQRLSSAGPRDKKLRTVMNTPDPAIFRRTSECQSSDLNFTVAYHGSIIQRLGIDIAIEAVALVRKDIENIRLRIIGTGDYMEEARRLVSRLGLEDIVAFEGLVPLEEIPSLLRAATVGVVPYYPNEATHLMLPVKLLEYATLGIPAISARLKAVEHYFSPAAIRYVKPGDIKDLGLALIDLYKNPDERIRLTKEAGKMVDENNWDRERQRLYEALDSLYRAEQS
jgi:glycosyltransferase involved in cell wall biosynthesis